MRTLRRRTQQAPLGGKVVAGGAYGSRLVADLVVNKYWYGLPLNRQREMLTRLGLDMPKRPWATRSTGQPGFSSPFTDTSSARRSRRPCSTSTRPPLPVKDSRTPRPGSPLGSLWDYVGDESAVVFLYTRSGHKVGQVESEIGPETFLAARTGFVVADAAAVLRRELQRGDLIEVGCNINGRRYFVKGARRGRQAGPRIDRAFRAPRRRSGRARALDDDARLALRQKPLASHL
ncbi:MAG: transposase [Polyangiaceae bacterium]|nr:transposase [Polyangiaceae bacterium]